MPSSPSLRRWLAAASIPLFVFLALASQCANWQQVFLVGEVYFVDADCYSRMTRVQEVLQTPWQPIRHHAFENAPDGTTPHTTAPVDLLIAGLARTLQLFHPGGLDLAGAFFSPLLGMALIALLGIWAWRMRWPAMIPMLLLASLSPILAHGFALGRPDHQSLLILLVGIAWMAEASLWLGRGGHLISAIAWALALWTSLFEPLILLTATMLLRALVLRSKALPGRRALAVFFAILLAGFLFDGWRASRLGVDTDLFLRWASTIGELRHPTPAQIFSWTGWLLPAAPMLLLVRYAREKNMAFLAVAALLLLLIGLCLWHARWGYFLALAYALSLPLVLTALPWRKTLTVLFLISLWPLAREWDATLFPDQERASSLAEARKDAYFLRETSRALVAPDPEIVLAPWWLSPAIAYWSGQNCVAGSSHQSLPGTIDTARFYLSTDPEEARRILATRRVAYVVAYEPARILQNSSQILGQPIPAHSLGEILFRQPSRVPDFLRPVYQDEYFKVYAFTGL